MSTESKLVVLVATLAGSQDIVGGDDLDVSQNVQSGGDLVTAGELGEVALTQLLSNANGRDIGTLGARRRAKSGGDGASDVVVNNGTDCTSATSKSRLQAKVTATAGDEGDVASEAGRVVGCFTTEVADGDQGRSNRTIGRVGVLEEVGLNGRSVDGEGVDSAIQHDIVGERLKGDIVVRGRLKLLLQPVDRVVVCVAAHDPVTVWVAVGEVLELLSAPHELLGGDVGFELPLRDC